MPQEFLDVIKKEWQLAKNDLKNSAHFHYVFADESQDFAAINRSHKLHDIVKSFISVPYDNIVFLINNPHGGLGPVHIDANRGCAINIPVELDLINSCFFIANQECTERPISETEGMANTGTRRYLYEPHKYDYYNSREAVLMNNKKTHGFFNYSDKPRVLFSIGFNSPYDEVLEKLLIND